MLEVLFGTKSRELVLQYLFVFDAGHAREMSRYFEISLPSIQNQLRHLEDGGVILSEMCGRTRRYFLNPRYAFLKELRALLERVRKFYKPELLAKLTMQRKRPRRPDKRI